MPVSKARSSHEENRPRMKGSKSANINNRARNTAPVENNDDINDAARVTVKDLRLPDTTVFRLMKEVLPKDALISQEVKDVMRRVPTIFALFLTDHALQQTHAAKRRTLLPEDVVAALHQNGFGSYAGKVMPVVEQRRANFRSRKGKLNQPDSLPSEEPASAATDVSFDESALLPDGGVTRGGANMAHAQMPAAEDGDGEDSSGNSEDDDSDLQSDSDEESVAGSASNTEGMWTVSLDF